MVVVCTRRFEQRCAGICASIVQILTSTVKVTAVTNTMPRHCLILTFQQALFGRRRGGGPDANSGMSLA